MIPQVILLKIAKMAYELYSHRLAPVEDYVHKENELDVQMREMKMELKSVKEQVALLRELILKYSA